MRPLRFRDCLSVMVVATIIAPVVLPLAAAGQNLGKHTDDKIAAMVESLASPNKEPKLVERARDLGERQCVLPPGYDMATQARIQKSANQLVEKGPSAFPALIDHFGDKRYCVSSVVFEDKWWSNYSVGDVCRDILAGQIQPWGRFTVGARGPGDQRPSYFGHHLDSADTARRWYAAHKTKSLREMQIAALEWTIDRETKSNGPRYTADLKYLRELLERLRTSKDPLQPEGELAHGRINANH